MGYIEENNYLSTPSSPEFAYFSNKALSQDEININYLLYDTTNVYKPVTSNELRSKMDKIWSDIMILMDRRAVQNVK